MPRHSTPTFSGSGIPISLGYEGGEREIEKSLDEILRQGGASKTVEGIFNQANQAPPRDPGRVTVPGGAVSYAAQESARKDAQARIEGLFEPLSAEEGGGASPFTKTLLRYGIKEGTSHAEAGEGIWKLFNAFLKREPGAMIAKTDLSPVRKYIASMAMLHAGEDDPWYPLAQEGGDPGISPLGWADYLYTPGHRRQKTRLHQAQAELMDSIMGGFDPKALGGLGSPMGGRNWDWAPETEGTDNIIDRFLDLRRDFPGTIDYEGDTYGRSIIPLRPLGGWGSF